MSGLLCAGCEQSALHASALLLGKRGGIDWESIADRLLVALTNEPDRKQ